MRADRGAFGALNTQVGFPDRISRASCVFPSCGARWKVPSTGKRLPANLHLKAMIGPSTSRTNSGASSETGDRRVILLVAADGTLISNRFAVFDLRHRSSVDNSLTAFAVGLLDGFLDLSDRLFTGPEHR